MKILIPFLSILAFFNPAYATRSRMNSLSQDPNQGSFYLEDNRNFFRNPANAAKMKNFMVAELAANYSNEVQNNVEGGYFGEFNPNFVYGIYLGKQAVQDAVLASIVSNASNTFLTSMDANPINLFLAGGNDLKWGLDINYAQTDEETKYGEVKYEGLAAAIGIEFKWGLQGYLNYNIVEKSEGSMSSGTVNQSNELDNSAWQAGLIYNLKDNYTIFAQYGVGSTEIIGTVSANIGSSPEDTGSLITITGNPQLETESIILGIGKIYELNPTTRFNFDLSWQMAESKLEKINTKISKETLPLVIGVEADATSWLVVRGSIRQSFILGEYTRTILGVTTKNSSNSAISATEVALGSTFNFGKLKIDGNLGGIGGANDSTLFDTSNFFVNAAAYYYF